MLEDVAFQGSGGTADSREETVGGQTENVI
jgi:hypothetical protein